MRFPLPILSFVLALVAGIGLVQLRTYVTERNYPGFTKEEASAMVGHRVEHIFWSNRFRVMKFRQNDELCGYLMIGERGTVTGINKEFPGGYYFFVVRWDEPSRGEPLFSSFGRMSSRISLKIE